MCARGARARRTADAPRPAPRKYSALSPGETPRKLLCGGVVSLRRLLRHEQSRFFAHAKVFTVPIRGIERFVNESHVPIAAVGNFDHVASLALQMRQAHQKMQLSW